MINDPYSCHFEEPFFWGWVGLMEEILHQLRLVVYSIRNSQGSINSWWLAGYLPSTGDDVMSCRLLYHAVRIGKNDVMPILFPFRQCI